jgi:hypothetical protein
MPDREELTLVVTLDDQASAGLANLKNQLANLGNAPGLQALGQASAKAGAGVKDLHGGLAALATRAGFIGGAVGGVTSELVKFGISVMEDATNVQKLVTEINNMSTAAARMGMTTTALENNLRAFRASGVSVEAATKNVAGFSDALADLSLVNSRLRGNLLSGGFLEIPKMFDFMQRLDVAKTTKEKLEITKKAMDEIQERWTRLGNPELGARMARQFREQFNTPDLDQFVARVREVGDVEKEVGEEREKNAAELQKHLADAEVGYNRITGAVGGMLLKLDESIGASRRLGELLNGIANGLETIAAGKVLDTLKVTPQQTPNLSGVLGGALPGFETQQLGPPQKPPEWTIPKVKPGAGPVNIPLSGMGLNFMGGGGLGGGGGGGNLASPTNNPVWQQIMQGRSDVDFEDRRVQEENTEQTRTLTRQIEDLNTTLSGSAPPGSLAAQLGLNNIGGGGGLTPATMENRGAFLPDGGGGGGGGFRGGVSGGAPPLNLPAGPAGGAGVYQKMLAAFKGSSLVGKVPADGARFGITTGSPEEWARFGTAVANAESGFNPRSANTSDPGGSFGILQYAHGQVPGGNAYDTDASIAAFVRDAQS